MTINFPALGETPVEVEHYLPNTIDLQGGNTRPYGVMVNGTVFVNPTTFAQIETGNLDLVVRTISLEPFSFDLDSDPNSFDQLRSTPYKLEHN